MKKKIVVAISFVIVIVLINDLLNFCLVKPGLARIMFHEMETGNYSRIILGTSHGTYGINADIVTEKTGDETMNMSLGGEYMSDMYYILKEACSKNDVKSVVMEVDFQYLIQQPDDTMQKNYIYYVYPNGINKLSYFYGRISESDYRAAVFPWTDSRHNIKISKDIVKTKLSDDYREYSADATIGMHEDDVYKGHGFLYRNRYSEALSEDNIPAVTFDENEVVEKNKEYFIKTINYAKKHNIDIFVVVLPISRAMIENSKEEYNEVFAYIEKMSQEAKVDCYNFNLAASEEYPSELSDYYDYDGHYYGDSAERFSKAFGEFLLKRKEGRIDKEKEFRTVSE